MTERQKIEIAEQKISILEKDGWRCTYPGCNNVAINLAHGISQGPTNEKIYGKGIVHHPYNMFSVCEIMEHNDYFNITNKPGVIERLLWLIENKQGLNSRQVWREINE